MHPRVTVIYEPGGPHKCQYPTLAGDTRRSVGTIVRVEKCGHYSRIDLNGYNLNTYWQRIQWWDLVAWWRIWRSRRG